MVQTLAWSIVSPEYAKRCFAAADVPVLRDVLRDVDSDTDGALLHCGNRSGSCSSAPPERSPAQVMVLLDLYAHLIVFAKSRQMSAEKLSTLVSLVHEVHERSMAERYTRAASYDLLRDLLVRHSVARPPFSAAIFDLDDVQHIDTYLLSTYYRHYKLYVYAFVPRRTATIRTVAAGALAEVPPASFAPLAAAIPFDEWKARVEEREREREAAEMSAELHESEEAAARRQREAGLNDPFYSDGIREQLETIRKTVADRATDRLEVIEQKLTAIETKVGEMANTGSSKPPSRSVRKK